MSQNVFRQSAALPANVACCRQAPVGAAGRLLAVAGRALWAGSGGPWPAAPARLPAGLEGVAKGPVRPARTLRGDLSSRAAPPCWVRRERAWRRPCVLLVCVPGSPLGVCALSQKDGPDASCAFPALALGPAPDPFQQVAVRSQDREPDVRAAVRRCCSRARTAGGGRAARCAHAHRHVCVCFCICVCGTP